MATQYLRNVQNLYSQLEELKNNPYMYFEAKNYLINIIEEYKINIQDMIERIDYAIERDIGINEKRIQKLVDILTELNTYLSQLILPSKLPCKLPGELEAELPNPSHMKLPGELYGAPPESELVRERPAMIFISGHGSALIEKDEVSPSPLKFNIKQTRRILIDKQIISSCGAVTIVKNNIYPPLRLLSILSRSEPPTSPENFFEHIEKNIGIYTPKNYKKYILKPSQTLLNSINPNNEEFYEDTSTKINCYSDIYCVEEHLCSISKNKREYIDKKIIANRNDATLGEQCGIYLVNAFVGFDDTTHTDFVIKKETNLCLHPLFKQHISSDFPNLSALPKNQESIQLLYLSCVITFFEKYRSSHIYIFDTTCNVLELTKEAKIDRNKNLSASEVRDLRETYYRQGYNALGRKPRTKRRKQKNRKSKNRKTKHRKTKNRKY